MVEVEESFERLRSIGEPLALLHGLIEHSPVPYAVFQADGHCLLTNPAYRRLFGRAPPREYDIFRDEVTAKSGLSELVRRAFRGETLELPTFWYDPSKLEHAPAPDAKRVAISCTLIPLRAAGGDVSHVAITYRDVTAELLATQAVEAERDLLRAIVEQSGDGIIVSDEHGVIREFNPEAERQHGTSKRPVSAPDWAQHFGLSTLDGQPLALDDTPLYRALLGEHVEEARWLVGRADGQARILVGTARPLRRNDGSSAGAILTTRDETDLRREHARARFLAEASAELSSSLDWEKTLGAVTRLIVPYIADWCLLDLREADGTFRRVEVAHADADDEALAREFKRFSIQPDAHPEYPPCRALASGHTTPIDCRALVRTAHTPEHAGLMARADPCSGISVPLITRGTALGVLTVFYARSRRHYSAEDVSTLEELARRAATAFDNALLYRSAETAARIREEFLSIASHELKTPLTPIQLQAAAIERQADAIGKDEAACAWLKKRSQHLLRSCERLNRIVDELLSVSRITGKGLTLELESVDLWKLVSDVVHGFRTRGEDVQSGCELRISRGEGELVGHWDTIRVQQIVTNLIANALKYAAGQPVLLTAQADGNQAVLRVRDHGIGIPAEAHERIFERFERAVSARNYAGLGVGLFVSREIARALGGDITVSSRLGAGAEFVVRLPLCGPTVPAP